MQMVATLTEPFQAGSADEVLPVLGRSMRHVLFKLCAEEEAGGRRKSQALQHVMVNSLFLLKIHFNVGSKW